MRAHVFVGAIAGLTALTNFLLGVAAAQAVGAGVAVLAVGELAGWWLRNRTLASAPVAAVASGHPLSRREVEVAVLIAQGLTSKEVGRRLFIERATVDTHVQHIYNKLSIDSRPQLAIWLMDHGLLHRDQDPNTTKH